MTDEEKHECESLRLELEFEAPKWCDGYCENCSRTYDYVRGYYEGFNDGFLQGMHNAEG